jgi:hypothetical protein
VKNAFYVVGKGALGMSLWPEKFDNHWFIRFILSEVNYEMQQAGGHNQ